MSSRQSSDDALRLAHSADPDETVSQAVAGAGPRPDVAPASTVGRYVVLDLLGVGGMGVVCTAYDPKLDRKVALKLLRDRDGTDESQASHGRARLLREAQALAKLSHPNIITVHDVDTYDDQLYIAMEYVEGRTVKEWLAEEEHGWREVVEVFVEAGRGLAAAHEAGITHRDFKPANVLMGDDGRVRVADFGLAKGREERELDREVERTTGKRTPVTAVDSGIIDMMRSASASDLTQIGHSVGTPAYMAPEQHMGFGVGPHTDQFSFCVSLFEALYGVLPFAGDTIEDRFQHMVEGVLREPPRDAQVPNWVYRALERGLRPQAADRFPDMNQLLAQLSRDPAKRRRRIATLAAFAGLAGAAALGVYQASAGANALCEGAGSRLVGVWDDARRDAVHDAFVATDKPYADEAWTRVESTLDAYTRRWTELHRDVCTATHVRGEQSEALLDVRMACLDRRLDQVGALVDVYAAADDTIVVKAAASVDSLDDLETCAKARVRSEKQAMPSDPDERAAIEGVQRELAVVSAKQAAGEQEGTLELAKTAADHASALPHLPTRGEAMLLLGRAFKRANEPKQARESFEEVVRTAAAAEDPDLEATGWANLVQVVGFQDSEAELGLALVLPAEAALSRVEDPRLGRHTLLNNMANVRFGQGDYREAELLFREALALLEELYGPESTRSTAVLSNLASALGAQREFEKAEPIARRAVALTRLRYGDDHPELAGVLQNHANVLSQLDRDDEARESFEEALAIRERALPSGHAKIGDSLTSVASLYRRSGEHDRAHANYLRALEIYRESLPAGHPKFAILLNNLGALERTRGRHQQSLEHHRAALEVALERLKPEHPRVSVTHRHICRALHSLERDEEALDECRKSTAGYAASGKALDLAETLQLQASVLHAMGRSPEAERALERGLDAVDEKDSAEGNRRAAELRFELAKMSWARPSSRPNARELANDARVAFAKAGDEGQLAEVEAWLDAHRLP
jgi:serine/threonine protein kinase/Tfp pilus assembly protein PilF